MAKKKAKVCLSTNINEETLSSLREYCTENGRVQGWVVETAIVEYLDVRSGRSIEGGDTEE